MTTYLVRNAQLALAMFFAICLADPGQASDALYSLGPDSQRQEGVPTGTVTEQVWKSEVFPGTIRRYWTYVPAQYDGSEEAAVIVFQDGHTYVDPEGQFRATVVLDNLIHRKELPVMIGIFVDPRRSQ